MNDKKKMIELDGSQGEGGGQILRSALTLSMITQTPFSIDKIRARRSKPGLLRQHLTAVNAAAEICGAKVNGAQLGSTRMMFIPEPVRGGDYRYAIGTAGSCTLVLQTVLPALWFADAPSTIMVSGGTHNLAAPPADFLIRSWQPLMQRMGVAMKLELQRHGFYPAGGGRILAQIEPVKALSPLQLETRGDRLRFQAEVVLAGLPQVIAERELEELQAGLTWDHTDTRILPANEGPGNVILLSLQHQSVCEVVTSFGEKRVSAKAVAAQALKEAKRYLNSSAAAGEHLADQLVLPMALSGKGALTTTTLSSHLQSNIAVIEQFLPVEFSIVEQENCLRIAVR